MDEEYWLKYGFKENGEVCCVRMLSKVKPEKQFFYTEKGECKPLKNCTTIKLTKENLNNISNITY